MPIVAITFVTFGEWPIGSRTPIRKSGALTLLPGRKSDAIGAALTFALVRRSIAERLRGTRRGARLLWLKSLLRLLIRALSLRRRRETIRQRAEIAVVLKIVLALSGLSLLTALCERLCGLRSGDESKVVLGVL